MAPKDELTRRDLLHKLKSKIVNKQPHETSGYRNVVMAASKWRRMSKNSRSRNRQTD